MLPAAAVALLLGLTLLLLGLRGTRIDDHPLCRKCRFDLIGLSLPRCPECGTDSTRTRTGNRRRIRAAITLGLLLTLAALAVGGAIGWGKARAFNWNTIKPEWWLIKDAHSLDTATADAALAEFASRLSTGTLTKDRAAALLTEALSRQSDPNQSWSVGWADLLQAMYGKDALTDDQKSAYARAAPIVTLSGRPNAVQGGNWRPVLGIRGGRIARSSGLNVLTKLLSLTIDGTPTPRLPAGNSFLGLSGGGSSNLTFPIAINVPPGTHSVVARWSFAVQEGYNENAPKLATWEQEFSVPVQVVPPGTPLVTLLHDDAARAAVEHCITVSRNSAQPATDMAKGGKKITRVYGTITFAASPVPIAHGLYWRYAGPDGTLHESLVETVICTAGSGQSSIGYQGELPADFTADHVDIILRPDPIAAGETETLMQIWDGEVTLRDVPVNRADNP